MATAARFLIAGTAIALALAVFGQEPAQRTTTEQRLAALEAAMATMDTRLGLERTRSGDDAGQTDVGLSSRITALERAVERLTTDLQRAERLADSAARAASEAQRDAMRAEQAARDAALRTR
jgi:hypothetical protein